MPIKILDPTTKRDIIAHLKEESRGSATSANASAGENATLYDQQTYQTQHAIREIRLWVSGRCGISS
jgi:hypothetical protein